MSIERQVKLHIAIWLALVAMAVIIAVLAGSALPAKAQVVEQLPGADHGHATFWISKGKYTNPNDPEVHCCGAGDCKMLDDDDMEPTAAGWLIKSLGETVPYPQSYTSEDGHFWRCKKSDGSRRCFFAPQPSS